MFGLGNAFKPRKYYVFDYKPRYYDERKERIEKLKQKYSDAPSDEETEDAPELSFSKTQLRNAWKKNKTTSADVKSTRRLAIIIAILVGIVAYVFELHKLI
ncbi:hypothetical protein RQM59_06755 [Flavobacteriaceae bacterium S356]|uniref:Uncharacterized protein n=1 Tax=Asprobacillus argus TaxID=3076534 RepID=A0ABU3LG13_9FLAO|nr:hypothetical protein [Flavobacteriaceae bacterium S356]